MQASLPAPLDFNVESSRHALLNLVALANISSLGGPFLSPDNIAIEGLGERHRKTSTRKCMTEANSTELIALANFLLSTVCMYVCMYASMYACTYVRT